jgi:hypothetical protein
MDTEANQPHEGYETGLSWYGGHYQADLKEWSAAGRLRSDTIRRFLLLLAIIVSNFGTAYIIVVAGVR